MFNASLVDIPRPYIDSIDTLVEALGIACLALEHPLHVLHWNTLFTTTRLHSSQIISDVALVLFATLP